MSVVGILQARMGSTRLPEKILSDLAGKPMLLRIVERLRSKVKIIIATTTADSDDKVDEFCAQQNLDCYRGSEEDVLDRYYQAAQLFPADTIIRLTGDNPLVDADYLSLLLERFDQGKCDYVSGKGFPLGLSAEVFSYQSLERAWKEATAHPDREHVTAFIHRQPELFRVCKVEAKQDWSYMRWTVDTVDDMRFANTVFSALGDTFSWSEVLDFLVKHPEITEINSHVPQKQYGE